MNKYSYKRIFSFAYVMIYDNIFNQITWKKYVVVVVVVILFPTEYKQTMQDSIHE